MSDVTLIRWAEENEQIAADYRIVAGTDPARYKPAMEAARAHDAAAARYRSAASPSPNPHGDNS